MPTITRAPTVWDEEEEASYALLALFICLGVAAAFAGALRLRHVYEKHHGIGQGQGGGKAGDDLELARPNPLVTILDTSQEQNANSHFESVIPKRLDAEQAMNFSGHLFSQEEFDKVKGADDKISRADFLAKKHETGPRHGAYHSYSSEEEGEEDDDRFDSIFDDPDQFNVIQPLGNQSYTGVTPTPSLPRSSSTNSPSIHGSDV